ncbi:hypothetical protein GW17_00062022 [Ensete ventricosum]|nr:hypothetical protein GW17_00062022 [Ensete ventricosum]
MGLVTGMRCLVPMFCCVRGDRSIWCDHPGRMAPGARKCGQADAYDELRARVSSWPPLRLARKETRMRRVIGIDLHRTFGEVVIWEDGILRHAGRVDMTRTALEGLGKSLRSTDEVVIEATGNSMAVSRVLTPFVTRVIIANPLQVKAIAQAHVKTDKIDAGTLASLHAAGYLPQIWTPDAVTELKRRLAARRYQVVKASHTDQERGPFDLARAPNPEVPACRSVQCAWQGVACPSTGTAVGPGCGPSRTHQQDRPQSRSRHTGGGGIAAVAVARKLTVLCWHLLTKDEDYLWARPALVASKTRAMELQAGHPQQKGCRRGPAYAYNVKALRNQEILVATQAERSYERFTAQWEPRRPKDVARGRLKPAGRE